MGVFCCKLTNLMKIHELCLAECLKQKGNCFFVLVLACKVSALIELGEEGVGVELESSCDLLICLPA